MPNIIRATLIRAITRFLAEYRANIPLISGDTLALARCQRHIDELNAALAWVDAQ